jgi:hypothetical protein
MFMIRAVLNYSVGLFMKIFRVMAKINPDQRKSKALVVKTDSLKLFYLKKL